MPLRLRLILNAPQLAVLAHSGESAPVEIGGNEPEQPRPEAWEY